MKISLTNDVVEIDYDGNRDTDTLPVREFAERLFTIPNSSHRNFAPLPENIRWISSDGRIIVVERPPTKQLLRYKEGRPGHGGRPDVELFEVALPWQIYKINIEARHVDVFFSKKEITSTEDPLYCNTLPNVDPRGTACLGPQRTNDMFDALPENGLILSRSGVVAKVIAGFWDNVFNDDMNCLFADLPQDMRDFPGAREAVREAHDGDIDQDFNHRDNEIPGMNQNRPMLQFLESRTVENICDVNWVPTGLTFGELCGMGNYAYREYLVTHNGALDTWVRAAMLAGRNTPLTAAPLQVIEEETEADVPPTSWDLAMFEANYLSRTIERAANWTPPTPRGPRTRNMGRNLRGGQLNWNTLDAATELLLPRNNDEPPQEDFGWTEDNIPQVTIAVTRETAEDILVDIDADFAYIQELIRRGEENINNLEERN